MQQIETRRAILRQKFQLSTEGVLRNLSQAVFFDPRKLFKPDGSLKRVIDLDDDTAMALQSFEVTESISGKGEDATPIATNKVKWLDKNSARDQANRILGQYKDKIEVGADDDFVKAMLNGRARAAAKR